MLWNERFGIANVYIDLIYKDGTVRHTVSCSKKTAEGIIVNDKNEFEKINIKDIDRFIRTILYKKGFNGYGDYDCFKTDISFDNVTSLYIEASAVAWRYYKNKKGLLDVLNDYNITGENRKDILLSIPKKNIYNPTILIYYKETTKINLETFEYETARTYTY